MTHHEKIDESAIDNNCNAPWPWYLASNQVSEISIFSII